MTSTGRKLGIISQVKLQHFVCDRLKTNCLQSEESKVAVCVMFMSYSCHFKFKRSDIFSEVLYEETKELFLQLSHVAVPGEAIVV